MRAALRVRQGVFRARGQEGASAVEYGLVVSLIAAVLVLVLFALGRIAGGTFGSIDCWSSTGGSACAQAAADTSDTVPVEAQPEPIVVAEPAPTATVPAPAAPETQKQLCNQSSNGSGKGKGQGSCK